MPGRPGNGNRGKLKEKTIDDAEDEARAARLRASGMSYSQIAAEMGCSESTAHGRVWRAIRSAPVEDGTQLRDLELARLDALTAKAWTVLVADHPLVSNGRKFPELQDSAPVLAAIRELRHLSESRRKLLGLDAPVKHDVKVSDALDADIERLVAELAGTPAGSQGSPARPAASRAVEPPQLAGDRPT